jgi:PPM family protein phosphatase
VHPVIVGRSFRVQAQAITDLGVVREFNEDHFGSFPAEGLYLVADGMGGHGLLVADGGGFQSPGGLASRLAVDAVFAFFKETAANPANPWPFKMDRARSYEENRLSIGVRLACRLIVKKAEDDKRWWGMGTTIAALSVTGARAQIAHVGDCRVYRLRGGALEPLTRDHSLFNEYLAGRLVLTEEQAATMPKEVLMRNLGTTDDVAVDVRTEEISEGDLYLLSTDGLHAQIEDREIAGILLEHPALDVAVQKLVDAANQRGGHDNVTALLVRFTAR